IADRGDTGLHQAKMGKFDLVISDFKLPGMNGLELVKELHTFNPRLPIILMTAHGTTETAIEATKLGAYDYLLKPFEMEEMLDLVGKAVESSRLMTEPVEMGGGETGRNAIIGNSRVMQQIYKEIGRIAAKPVTVLIRGETGTGKELIARALYQHSDRIGEAFVVVNCAAIPETLLESELFGHERGAFTGADTRRIGRFEQADRGTIFLDEIGDMSLSTQAKLLRVLQERYIQRLGGKENIAINVRVIAATHRELEAAIVEKTFREDLFYRLNVVSVKLPPLRQRAEDIPALVRYFLQKYGSELGVQTPSIQPDALEFLREQPWPGNIRELENVVRQAMLLARRYTITLDHIREVMSKVTHVAEKGDGSMSTWITELLAKAKRGETERIYAKVFEGMERELFTQAIQMAHGNQAKAARWLGISRLTMREKLTTFGLRPGIDDGDDTSE
ncbi:MAG: two component, sigma54 specific, transcriptional regulator, Fis family, partial [Verrucomicrobiales bacterium]|nr:two component, sigma54 specific, transcriptional regulator, Fis family [Verrucomicrobiales bacterium]